MINYLIINHHKDDDDFQTNSVAVSSFIISYYIKSLAFYNAVGIPASRTVQEEMKNGKCEMKITS